MQRSGTHAVPYGQPPAWVPIVPAGATYVPPTSSYVWAQPGSVVKVPYAQPPARVHIVP